MLINFSVGNFLSFKERQKLDLKAEALKELKHHLHVPYLYDANELLLKSVAIYGHNSHGKTNLVKAYRFFINFVFSSFAFGRNIQDTGIEPFRLNTSTVEKPSFFEITFIIRETKYRYGFEATHEKIVSEWLFYANAKIRENHLFIRSGQEFDISKTWNKETENKVANAQPFTKQSNLFLSVLNSQEGIPRIDSITKWLGGNIIVVDSDYDKLLIQSAFIYSETKYRDLIRKFIEVADVGFDTIFDKIERQSNTGMNLEKGLLHAWYEKEIGKFELSTRHNVFDENYKFINSVEFDLLKNESAGAVKFFVVVSLLAYAIKHGQLIWFDELDAKFHTLLIQMLVKTYHDPKVNQTGSQLIFVTHNTVFLDKKLRRDQMVVVEKNEYGESSLRRMHSTKQPIRIDKSIEKEYREGNLGGISEKLKNYPPSLFD